MKSIGIDIGKDRCNACVKDADGTILYEVEFDTDASTAKLFATDMAKRFGEVQALFESTGNYWGPVYDGLERAGVPSRMANMRLANLITHSSKKTDRTDARKLADMDRANMFQPCHIPSRTVRGHKEILRQRASIVRDRTAWGNKLHAILAKYGYDVSGRIFGVKNLQKIEEMRFDASDDFVVRDLVQAIRNQNDRIENFDRVIKAFAGAN